MVIRELWTAMIVSVFFTTSTFGLPQQLDSIGIGDHHNNISPHVSNIFRRSIDTGKDSFSQSFNHLPTTIINTKNSMSRPVRRMGSEFLGKKRNIIVTDKIQKENDSANYFTEKMNFHGKQNEIESKPLILRKRNILPYHNKKNIFRILLSNNYGGDLFGKRVSYAFPKPRFHDDSVGSEFLGKRGLTRSEFLGKRGITGSEFLGKRGFTGSEFLGKKNFRGSEFLGKRGFAGSEFLGKTLMEPIVTNFENETSPSLNSNFHFINEKQDSIVDSKNYIDKYKNEYYSSNPVDIDATHKSLPIIEKLLLGMPAKSINGGPKFFMTKRGMGSEFLGKRGMGSEFLGKRSMGSEFLGKRKVGAEFLGKRKMGPNYINDKLMKSQFSLSRGLRSVFLGKRRYGPQLYENKALGSEFFGKRLAELNDKRGMGSEFLGKRGVGSEFLGKRTMETAFLNE